MSRISLAITTSALCLLALLAGACTDASLERNVEVDVPVVVPEPVPVPVVVVVVVPVPVTVFRVHRDAASKLVSKTVQINR